MKNINFPKITNIPRLLARYQIFLAVMVCTATLGFTAYQVSMAFNATPDLEYLAAQKEKQDDVRIKSNAKALKALRNLRATGYTSPSLETGKSDPFSF